METEAWIIDAVRSPRGKGKKTGALHDVARCSFSDAKVSVLASFEGR
jgi:hypothetical protein